MISIHAPRTGSDGFKSAALHWVHKFQSTLPARGATRQPPARASSRQQFQSTLPARGATTFALQNRALFVYFNPRSPHGERPPTRSSRSSTITFQSTLPARGATTIPLFSAFVQRHFNPRSPHGERPPSGQLTAQLNDFNPRSPHGERRFQIRSPPLGA